MDQVVAHTGDEFPLDSRIPFAHFEGEPLDRFSDNLEAAYECALPKRVIEEVLP